MHKEKLKLFKTLILMVFLANLSIPASAVDSPWTHFGLRPLGMGNAFVAISDDFNALFYNPAGLARLEKWDGELINPSFTIADRTSTFFEDAQDIQKGDGGGIDSILDLMEKQSGRNHYLGLAFTPHLLFPGFGFGLGVDFSSSLVFHRYPSVSLDFGPKVLVPISYALSFLDKKISLGLSAKWAFRTGINRDFSVQDLQTFAKKEDGQDSSSDQSLSDYLIAGSGFGADLGFLFTPMKPLSPTFGLMLADLGGTPYKKLKSSKEGTSLPPPRPMTLAAGLSLRPYQGKRSYLSTSFDIHEINLPKSVSKKLHFGSELGLGEIYKIQAGLSQGYLSCGIQIDVGIVNIRAVTYAVEAGEIAGDNPDRRYALQLKLLI